MLVDLAGLGFQQNRLEFGLGRMLDAPRLDVGYLFRAGRSSRLGHDHILNVAIFFDVHAPNGASTRSFAPRGEAARAMPSACSRIVTGTSRAGTRRAACHFMRP